MTGLRVGLVGHSTSRSRNMAMLIAVLCSLFLTVTTDDSLNFLVLGDWGGQESSPYYTTAEKEVADVMGKKAQEINAKFVMALGDVYTITFFDQGKGYCFIREASFCSKDNINENFTIRRIE